MFDRRELTEAVSRHLERDPGAAREVLEAVSRGLAAWEAGERRRADADLRLAVLAALALPLDRKGKLVLNLEDRTSRDWARIVAWGLKLRHLNEIGWSPLYRELWAFVQAADLYDPEGAADHYRTLSGQED